MARLRIPRSSQPPKSTGADLSSKYASRVIDGFVGTSPRTLKGKEITETSLVAKKVNVLGECRSGAANAGFSFPCDITTSVGGATVVLQFTRGSGTGVQMLVEHSPDGNSYNGSFFFYYDTSVSALYIGTFAYGGYNIGYVTLPAVNSVTTLAVRMKHVAGVSPDANITAWVNGVNVAITPSNYSSSTSDFGSYETFFLSRNKASYFADASISMYAVLSGFIQDAELRELSLNPWQLFAPNARSTRARVAASASESALTPADGSSTASTLTGNALLLATVTAAAGVSSAGTMAGVAFTGAVISAANGVTSAGTLGASSVASTAPTSAAGTSTSASLAGQSSSVASLTSADGATSASAIGGSAVSAATITQADGATTASGISASATVIAAITQADGATTASTLTGTGLTAGASSITAAAGTSTAATLAGSSAAEGAITPADGATTAGTLSGADGITASSIVPASSSTTAAQFAASATAAVIAIAAAGASSASTVVGYGISAASVYPNPNTVLSGVQYGPTGAEYTGTMVSPTANDVAVAVMAAINATTIPVDAKKMNGATILGNGTSGDKWRG